jgi:hypothetical protein
VIRPFARASRRIAAPNCPSTRTPRLAQHALGQRELQPVVNDLLAGGDPRRLFGGQRRGKAEQALLE